jgi:hypothetical protein
MSYRQAFHTSCRTGLSGHAGFQFNAASGGLDDEQLARLAAAHAGYRASPDAPLEPGPGEIERLPVSLRYLPVDGVGPVISRTAYVGREFRGAGGEPDSGRFGNYFSHIVVADGGDFGGLLPIELWQAPHWSITESAAPKLPALDRLEPGPVDLDRVLAQLLPGRGAALAPVLDACLRSVLGGPRVVVVEPDAELAAAWVAWVSFALPPDRVEALTFSTFDGRPRVAEALRLCVTTPACEIDFPAYELGTAVVVVDVDDLAAAELSLYARVAAKLAESGAEAVAAAIRELGSGLDLDSAGAQLAVRAGCTGLAAGHDVPNVLAAIEDRLGRVPASELAAMARALPPVGDAPEALAGWSRLHAAARESGDPGATDLVDEALGRLLSSLDAIDGEVVAVDSGAPVAPSVGTLAAWLELVSTAAGSERLGPVVAAGARLGLVGCNTALDGELAGIIAAGFAEPAVRRAYESIAAAGNDRVVECVALELAAAVGAGGGLGALQHVAADPVAREAVRAQAERDQDFEAVAAWELLRVSGEPSRRAGAVTVLAGLATTGHPVELIRGLYGDDGPVSVEDHAELLGGWAAAGRGAPTADCRRAFACLAAVPLRRDRAVAALFAALGKAPEAVRTEPDYFAWWLLFERPPKGRDFRGWAGIVAKGGSRLSGLSDSRLQEVRSLAADVAATSLEEDGYATGLEALLGAMGEEWPLELGDALGRALAASVNPERRLARAFVAWCQANGYRRELMDAALPQATQDFAPKRLQAVGEWLDEAGGDVWEQWLEEHPPRRAVSRAVRGVLRRGDRE